jgi:uncharacterized protein (UPF0276 family)
VGAPRVVAPPRRSFGVGLDLRWGDAAGFVVDPSGADALAPALRTFLAGAAPTFAHAFFSWQPRDRARLRLADYAPAWDALAASLPAGLPVGLHHTALNLATCSPAARGPLLDFTNALCERYDLAWINEDVGLWSLGGRPVPYPLPPPLDAAGLRACVRNVRACQRALVRPLLLEFPGFEDGLRVDGVWDAYDFFRALAAETGAPVTLDVAHLLSWRWRCGRRGEALFDGLERLPLAHAVELHLSGCEIRGERFIDAHHGRLLDEQLVLLERLLPLCPALRRVTFEDPRLDELGALDAGSRDSLGRLRAVVEPWTREPLFATDVPPSAVVLSTDELVDAPTDAAAGEAALAAGLDAGTIALVRDRVHRGTGRLVDAFPSCLAGWRAAHPDDLALDALFARFVASPQACAWREQPGLVGGACLEACFAAFARAERLAPPSVCEEELLSVLLRALTVVPDPAFDPPPEVRRAPGGWFAVSSADPPILHAALRGRYLRGPLTPALAALLTDGDEPDSSTNTAHARAQLIALGLLAPREPFKSV